MVLRHGAVIGALVVLGLLTVWAIYGLGTAWLAGDLDRTFPDCDPCGLAGYSVRYAVLVSMGALTIGPVGARAGWLVQSVAERARRPGPPPPR